MKKLLLLIILFNLIVIWNVKAVTVIPSGSGVGGEESATCSGDNNCANTVGLTITNSNVNNTGRPNTFSFSNTAIYGMRITIVDKKGKPISGYSPINFWATSDMKEVVGYNTEIKRRTTYTNAVDPTNTLFNYKNGGLRKLDENITSYKEYIFDLDADQVEKYLKAFNSSLTLSAAANNNYFLKCEPIFVYHYHNTKNPQNVYFGGTASEILIMITNQKLHKCSNQNYCEKVTDYNVNQWTLGYLSCGSQIINDKKIKKLTDIKNTTCGKFGNGGSIPIIFQYGTTNDAADQSKGHNIIRNYITTIYQQKNINGTSFTTYGNVINSNTDRLTLYREAMDTDGSGLSVGYIRLKDFTTEDFNITVYKYGNDGKCYDDSAYFVLRNNAGNLIVGGTGTIKGYESWCNADNTSKSITYKGSDYKSIVLGNTYNLYEYDSNTSTSEIKNAQYSLNGGPYKKLASNKSYYSFKFSKSNTVVKVKNNSNGGECTDSEDCCKKDLSEVIGGCSGNKCDNSAEVASKLLDLYNKYSEDDFNLLLNYEFTTTGLNVNQVSCGTTICSNGGIEHPSCESSSTLSPSTPGNSINRRVCFISNDDTTHTSKGNYYYDDIEAYCDVEYKFNFNLPNEQVKAGMLLWQQFPNYIRNIGSVDMVIHCENGYKGIAANALQNRKLDTTKFFDDTLPLIQLKWKTDGSNYTENINLVPDTNNHTLTNPTIECVGSGTNEYCYVTWDDTYKFNFRYNSEWYTNDSSGRFVKKDNLNDLTGYTNKGSGLPISIQETSKSEADVNVIVKTHNNSASFQCPYSVKNEILKCPSGKCGNDDDNPDPLSSEFNFDFRIIDTSNPFPGINGTGRYVGDNWCTDARIGKIAYKTSGEKYMVGDILGDDFYIGNNEYSPSFAGFTLANNPSADIDGDGSITYSGNCNEEMNDYCILRRYVTKTNRNNNCTSDSTKNNIIKKYITDAPNSNSTGKPMYSFTLTPNEIQNIRAYNKVHAYNDFNMVCDENGRNCLSNFLTDWIKNAQVNSKAIKVRVTDVNSSCYNTRSVNNKMCTNN